jgi:bacterioferritin-associated ferredoxin
MIAAGATSLCALAETCGAGSRCGGCHVALRQMLAEAGLDLPARASAPARATAA